jgi:hypothetical protein
LDAGFASAKSLQSQPAANIVKLISGARVRIGKGDESYYVIVFNLKVF